MDDQLFYVESPDGQVLGPMNMMLIIEGIADGAILDSARICEVGSQEWVTLSDVTHTREDIVPVDDLVPVVEDPIPVNDLEAPDAPWAAATQASDVEAEADEEPLVEEWTPQSIDQDAPVEAAADTDEFPIPEMETEDETQIEAAAIERDTAEFEVPEVEGAETEWEIPDPIAHEEPVSVPGEDPFEGQPFADGEGEDSESWPAGESEELVGAAPGGRPKWLVPALLMLVPVIAGVYLMTSGKSDETPEAASEIAATTPATPMEGAKQALAAGNAKEAEAGFLRVLAEEPESAEAHHGLGQAALLGKDAELAVTHLEQAWELSSDDPHWLTDLASALHQNNRTKSALKRIGTYLDAVPEDMEWQQARLDWMLESGRQDEAAKLYRALADGKPESAPEQYLAGVALGEGSKAETYLRRSIELDPSHGDAHVALARVLAVGGNTEAARGSLSRAFELRPASPEEQSFLASLEKAKPAAKVQTPVKTAAPAEPVVAAAPKAKPAPAKPVVAKSQPKPADPAAAQRADLAKRAKRVRAALAEANFDRAGQVLAKARKELGAGKEAARNLALWEGIVAFESGSFDDALAKFEGLNPAASYTATGWGAGAVPNWIARVHFAKGDVRAAVAALDGVGPGDPNEYAMARLWEGMALGSLGMTDLANRTWERIPVDVGNRVSKPGRAAVISAKYLLGSISEKDYLNQVGPIAGYENDMHFVMAYAARQKQDDAGARQHLELSVQASTGHEFPYYVAQAEMNGSGILK